MFPIVTNRAVLALLLAVPSFAVQAQEAEEGETVIVQSTRAGRRVQDEPVRVEIINREEIEEKILMRPGNISMLLSETGGLKVQVTSPALGAANVRVQGMRGRYTQLLTDGLPLYGGQAASIGLLQIAPTDLAQVEVIKGAASALYGASALGGVINLISKKPGAAAQAELLGNLTARGGQDVTAYEAAPLTGNWSQSLTAGLHHQTRLDLNHDAWADIPGYMRYTIRPRLFWNGDDGGSVYLTAGATQESRQGGTLPGRAAQDGAPFAQDQDTQRYDAGLVAQTPLTQSLTAHLRASAVTQRFDHRFGTVLESDHHETLFAEAALSGKSEKTSWITGLAFQTDIFRSHTFANFDYTHEVPALFAQAEQDLTDGLTLAASARLDSHNVYGARFSPRLSLLYRPGPWTFRASAGSGFYAPTPFVEEIEAAGLSRLAPLSNLKAETARSASLGGGYTMGPLEAAVTLFASDISHAVRLQTLSPTSVALVNESERSRTHGAEFLIRQRWDAFTVTANYVLVESRQPLTPHHTAGLVGMWEDSAIGRIGLEAYYTGPQDLEDNPYRTRSPGYFELGAMAERNFGPFSLYLNLENLLDVRQTKYDPLLRPARAPAGEWTVDAWAPTDGFTANGGIRWRFGGDGLGVFP